MILAYDRALLAKQCDDIIKTAERVRRALPWFDFVTKMRIHDLEVRARKVREDFDEV